MKEFDYELDYKSLDFTDPKIRGLYRIGRGEQGVLLVPIDWFKVRSFMVFFFDRRVVG